ncbi:MAG: FAD-dependent oxidoreductase, partial [Actinobacteria bacterium]|nr:FAD-dependent oxidoreductase [Actinomycetota bacterium]
RDELRAVKILQERAFNNEKISFLWSSEIVEFLGGDRVESIVIKNKKDGNTFEMKIDGVFEYVGLTPNSDLVEELVDLDEKGFVVTNSSMETSFPGIFAVGDVRNTPLRQVVTAVSDGAIAAIYAGRFLEEKQ